MKNPNDQNKPVDPIVEREKESIPEGSFALTPSQLGLITRAEIDSQIATAKAFPRDMGAFRKRALDQVTFDLETAESCIYHRPVGREKNPKTGRVEEKIAEGESIRMAEIIGATFGNLRVQARIVEQTTTYVKAEGVAHDLETNYAAKAEVIESTVTRDGSPYSARQSAVVAKAAQSKAYRDAVFRVVPKSMCKFARLAAEKMIADAAKGLKPEERFAKWVKFFQKRSADITPERILAALKVKSAAELTEEHFLELTGIRTALSDNETNLDEAFPPISQKPDMSAGNTAGAGAAGQAPEMFPAGKSGQAAATEGARQPTTAQPPGTPQTPLSDLRDKLAAAKIGEDFTLNYLIANFGASDSLQTLEEVFLSQSKVIPALLEKENWSAFAKAAKAAKK